MFLFNKLAISILPQQKQKQNLEVSDVLWKYCYTRNLSVGVLCNFKRWSAGENAYSYDFFNTGESVSSFGEC